MFGTAPVSDVSPVQSADRDLCYDRVDDWMTDGERVSNWQVELVDCCHVINDQLSQIRAGLNQSVSAAKHPPVSLRVVGSIG